MVSTELKPGEMLAAKFRIERTIGHGGMGVVMEATNVQLDQKFAIKLLARNADDPAVIERFMNEAKAAARLRSEHVARVYDVGKDPMYGPFIVMEYLDGKTLAEVLSQIGRVPLHRAVEHVIDACEGLAEAHARGIVHQDIKPANLFLVTGDDGRPSVKVLDFGIATMRTKEAAPSDVKSSAPRSQGTPAYLSPDQLRGNAPIDHRTDIWALGCVLYELISGERAFRSQRFTELVTKILEAPPDTLPADLELPIPVAQIIDRCLQKDPKLRYSSTGELALALLPFARRRAHSSVAKAVAHVKTGGLDPDLQMPSSMPPPPSGPDSGPMDVASLPKLRAPSAPSFSTAPVTQPESSPAEPPKSRLPLAAAVLFVAVALGGGGFAISRSMRTGASPGGRPLPSTDSVAGVTTVLAVPPESVELGAALPPPILVGSGIAPLDSPPATAVTNTRQPPPRLRFPQTTPSTPRGAAPTSAGESSEIRRTR